MKKIYVSPELEIEKFSISNSVLTLSGGITGPGQGGADEDLGEF